MTNNNSKYKLEATFTYLQGNLNNSSFIGSRRSILSSSLHPSFVTGFTDREGSFGVFARRVPNPNVIYFSLYRYYIIGPRQVKPHILLDRVTEAVNEYNSNCFYISVYKSNKLKLGEGVTLVFYISLKDEKLVRRLQLALGGCGQVLKINDSFIFRVQDSLSINKQIIPFFNKSNLQGKKLLAFEYLKKVAYLKTLRAHTTLEGLNEIKKIKRLMAHAISNHELSKCLDISQPIKASRQEELSLVFYGSNISSTIGSPRYTSIERALIKIPTSKMSVFIGIILSDATLQKGRGDARLQFKQKYSQFEYFYSVFFQLSHYCSKGPYVTKTILHKKVHFGLGFTTRSLPCITELYHLFYYEGKKIIPKNMFSLLTWEALVQWIEGDGTYSSGITLQTQCFTINELVIIINVLIIKFGLECTIHKQENYFVIYIKSKSLKKNLHYMLPYIHPTMLYKFKGPKYKLKSKYTTIG